MADPVGKKHGPKQHGESGDRVGDPAGERSQSAAGSSGPGGEPPFAIPEIFRRVVTMGLSGVFLTQENLRQAVGDALPKEWVDFATQQSERTRVEFLERLATEMARGMEATNLAQVISQVLEGRRVRVTADIQLLPSEGATDSKEGRRSSDPPTGGVRVRIVGDEAE